MATGFPYLQKSIQRYQKYFLTLHLTTLSGMEDRHNMIFICDLIYFTTVLLFGTAISFFLAGISVRKKNIICLLLFCSFEGLLQGIVLYFYGTAATKELYPLLTHLPLILLLVMLYKKSLLTAVVSVFSAYLCCQIPWWCAFFIDLFFSNKIIYTIIYVLSAITVLIIIFYYASDTIRLLITISKKMRY